MVDAELTEVRGLLARLTPGRGALVLVFSAGAQVGLTAFGGMWLWGMPAWLRLAIWLPIVVAEVVVLLAAWRWRAKMSGKLLFCCSIPVLVIFANLPFTPQWGTPGVLKWSATHRAPANGR